MKKPGVQHQENNRGIKTFALLQRDLQPRQGHTCSLWSVKPGKLLSTVEGQRHEGADGRISRRLRFGAVLAIRLTATILTPSGITPE